MGDWWIIGLAVIVGIAGLIKRMWLKNKIPDDAVVTIFEKNKYLGIWNVVARLPTRVEQHLKYMTEEFILNEDGSIKVLARAYNTENNTQMQTCGKIKSTGLNNTGKLQVAYYLPIYLDYNILDIDENYMYALVSGSSYYSLCILSRETEIPKYIKLRFIEKAEDLGFDIQQLRWMD